MISLYILGGVGVVLGVMASVKFTDLWRFCRYYYLVYGLLLVATLVVRLASEPSLPILWKLAQELGTVIAASFGWAIYAHLACTTVKPLE